MLLRLAIGHAPGRPGRGVGFGWLNPWLHGRRVASMVFRGRGRTTEPWPATSLRSSLHAAVISTSSTGIIQPGVAISFRAPGSSAHAVAARQARLRVPNPAAEGTVPSAPELSGGALQRRRERSSMKKKRATTRTRARARCLAWLRAGRGWHAPRARTHAAGRRRHTAHAAYIVHTHECI